MSTDDRMRARIAASVARVDGILVSADVARMLVHWLGQLAEVQRQRAGCPPVGLVEVQHAIGEELAAVSHTRQREQPTPLAPELVAFEYEQCMGTAEAAAELGVSADTVRWHCRNGNLDAKKVGRQLMVAVSSIESLKVRLSDRKGA